METQLKWGYVVIDQGFTYNDENYNIGGYDAITSILGPQVYADESDARKAAAYQCRHDLGEMHVGDFSGYDGNVEDEPAITCAKDSKFKGYMEALAGGGSVRFNSTYTYEHFFQDCGERGIDASQYLPKIYTILKVELDPKIKYVYAVPDEKIKAATDSLTEIHDHLKEITDADEA